MSSGSGEEAGAVPPRPVVAAQGPRLAAVGAWLRVHAEVRVAALGLDALPHDVPREIELGPGHVVEDRSLLDLVLPDDRAAVSTGFALARRTGQGMARARLAADGRAIAVNYLDLSPELPVVLRLCIDDDRSDDAPLVAGGGTTRARVGIITKDEAARIIDLDDGAVALLGWCREDVVGTSTLDHIHPDDHQRALENWWSMVLGSGAQSVRMRYRCGDGSWLWLDTSNSYDRGERGTGSVTCQVIDASREMEAADALRRNEQLLRRLAETVPVGLCFLAPDRTVSYLNPGLATLLGTSDVADLPALEAVLTTERSGSLSSAASDALELGLDGELEVTLERAGLPALRCRLTLSSVVDQDAVTGALICVVDVTELKTLATVDPLTGLLNRRAIVGMISDALSTGNGAAGVLFLDLNSFKPVNDDHGHRVGDQLLAAVAERLRSAVRDHDLVGRLGGDEFVILCPGLSREQDLDGVAARATECLAVPFGLGGVTVTIGASIGMTIGHGPQETAQQVVARADTAMYAAKRDASGPAWA